MTQEAGLSVCHVSVTSRALARATANPVTTAPALAVDDPASDEESWETDPGASAEAAATESASASAAANLNDWKERPASGVSVRSLVMKSASRYENRSRPRKTRLCVPATQLK